MRIIKPSFEILHIPSEDDIRLIEAIGRVCYKSEDKITGESWKRFLKTIVDKGHESVLEHSRITVRFICDRGVSHELVRHRLASFSQESTRYVNYGGKDIEYILPPELVQDADRYHQCATLFEHCEDVYKSLLAHGHAPQIARAVLPIALKTEIIVTANIREWRHILKLRTSKAAHPQIRELMIPLLEEFKKQIPVVFDDIRNKN